MTTKRCSRCKQTLPIDDFYCDRAARDGKQRKCKRCSSEQSIQWNRDNAAYRAYLSTIGGTGRINTPCTDSDLCP